MSQQLRAESDPVEESEVEILKVYASGLRSSAESVRIRRLIDLKRVRGFELRARKGSGNEVE